MSSFPKRLIGLLSALCLAAMLVLPALAAGSNTVLTIGDYEVDAAEFAYHIFSSIYSFGIDEDEVPEDSAQAILDQAVEGAISAATIRQMALDAGVSEKDALAYVQNDLRSSFLEQYGSVEAFQEAMEEAHLTEELFNKLFCNNYYIEQLQQVYTDPNEQNTVYTQTYEKLENAVEYGAAYQSVDVTAGYPYGLSMSGGAVNWEGGLRAAGWGAALTVVLVGLLVVFFVLLLLVLAVTLFGKIGEAAHNRAARPRAKTVSSVPPAAAAPAFKPAASPAPVPAPSGIPNEVVAAIMAAISCMTAGSGKSYRIKRIRKTADPRSLWSAAGVQENTRPF